MIFAMEEVQAENREKDSQTKCKREKGREKDGSIDRSSMRTKRSMTEKRYVTDLRQKIIL